MTRPRTSLARDDRGAIVVMALFMAVVAVGALYYLVGIGDAILMRERMQDAADASAFSGAIIYARGMNLLVLVNMMMAALLAALILYKLVAAAALAIGGFCASITWIWPLAAACSSFLLPLGAKMQANAPTIERKVDRFLKLGERVHQGIAKAVPLVAQARVIPYARTHFSPPATAGVLLPLAAPLPVVDGSFDRLCAKGGEYAGEAVEWAIDLIVPWDFVGEIVGEFTEDLAEKFARYLCGKGAMPSEDYTAEIPFPAIDSPHAAACKGGDSGACTRHEKHLKSVVGAFDFQTGECTGDAEVKSACEGLLRRARSECQPGKSDDPIVDWTWREVDVERTYVLREGVGVVLESEKDVAGSAKKKIHSKGSPLDKPCAQALVGVSPWTPWNTGAEGPVCAERLRSEAPSVLAVRRAGGRLVKTHTAVSDVVTCVKEVTKEIELESEPLKLEASPAEICNCSELGEQTFQLRAIVLSDPDAYLVRSERGVEIAALFSETRPGEPGFVEDMLDGLGNVSVAQAEYFVDGEHHAKRAEWMWHMHWKARLRRFRFEQDTGWTCPEKKNECPEPKLELLGFVPGPVRAVFERATYH